jgi:RNA polymerase sigma-B factor
MTLSSPSRDDATLDREPLPHLGTGSAVGTGHRRRPGTAYPDHVQVRALFLEFASLPAGHPRHRRIRDCLVELNLPLVEYLARRFRDRGEPLDDLIQVATIGLIKAVDRFDPTRGVEFSTYATPTIVGEVKRHFRDKGWAIHVPRSLQDLKLRLTRTTGVLSQHLGRSPTVGEIARHMGVREEEVLAALETGFLYTALSLDVGQPGAEVSRAATRYLGDMDQALEGVEDREALKPLLDALPPREKRILALRFSRAMSQSQIATELGISQMHVSRLLARTLAQLRQELVLDG